MAKSLHLGVISSENSGPELFVVGCAPYFNYLILLISFKKKHQAATFPSKDCGSVY